MKNKIIGILIMLTMFFSTKGLVSAKTIDVNDFVNEINNYNPYGVSASAIIDSQNNQIEISYGGLSMVVNYTDDYIEYNERHHNEEYYINHPSEMQQRVEFVDLIVTTIQNLYGVEDNYEQYGIQLEQDRIVVNNGGFVMWDEIVYFKLPLNTDNINNGTTDDKNNEVNNGTTDDKNNEENNGTTDDKNNEENNGTTDDKNNEEDNGTTDDKNNEVNNGTTDDKNNEVNNGTTNDENSNSDLNENKTKNPNTGDNILIYFGAFIILVVASTFTIRKIIMNK